MFEKIYPKKYVKWIEKNSEYVGINAKKFISFQFYFSLLVSIFVLFIFKNIFYFFVSFLFLNFSFAILFYSAKENAKKQIENFLPDVLSLISSNLKSGLTFERALLVSARPEFKNLEKILKRMAKEIASGKDIEKVLLEHAEKSEIESFRKVLYLLLEGFKKGSKISDLLFELSESLREQQILKKEMVANTSLYITFIVISLLFAMPLMFSLSYTFLDFLSKNVPKELPKIQVFNIPFGFRGLKIDLNFLKNLMIFQMLISSFFASLLLGVIKDGNEKAGLKYFLAFAPISLLFFYIGTIFLPSIFFILK